MEARRAPGAAARRRASRFGCGFLDGDLSVLCSRPRLLPGRPRARAGPRRTPAGDGAALLLLASSLLQHRYCPLDLLPIERPWAPSRHSDLSRSVPPGPLHRDALGFFLDGPPIRHADLARL